MCEGGGVVMISVVCTGHSLTTFLKALTFYRNIDIKILNLLAVFYYNGKLNFHIVNLIAIVHISVLFIGEQKSSCQVIKGLLVCRCVKKCKQH